MAFARLLASVWSLRGVAALWTSCTVGAGLCVKALGDWQDDISEPAVALPSEPDDAQTL